jgi:hypothetical protein
MVKFAYVSEECPTPIFGVEMNACSAYWSTLKIEAIRSFETPVI